MPSHRASRTDRHGRPGTHRAAAAALVGLATASLVVLTAPPAAADTQTVTNPTAMSIPNGGFAAGDHTGSTVYPSPVTVSGLTGTTTKVTVKLNGLSHTNVRDVEVLLVGPGGQKMVVMSDLGGNETVSNISPTFDDAAASAAPDTGLGSGTYKPTNLSNGFTGDLWPAPAPAGPYGTSFSVFNGTNPNGTWNLYLVDDASGDIGTLSGGWTLSVETGVATFPGVIQLSSVEYRGTEGGGVATVTVDRVSGDDGAVGVSFATGTGTATAGVDYTPVSTTLAFADGQTTRTVDVPITNDPSIEGIDELIPISISAPTGGATLGSPTAGQIRLQDNDARANAYPITVPASGPTIGASDPYPSNIVVAAAGGVVTDVDVTLTNVSHTHIRDVDVLLVAPNGTTTLLLQDVGPNTPVSSLNLTFSDEAASGISQAALASGTYKPSQFDDELPDPIHAPAPAGPYGTTLATLDGTSPNGTWSLYVVDDAGGDIGSISGGWSLSLTTATASAGGPYSTPEGSGVTLSGSTIPDVVGATYEWDVDGDGQYDDATGQNPTVSAGTLASIGLGDGPDSSSLRVRATSGSAVITSTATTLTVTNVAPTGTFTNNGPVTLGNTATVTFGSQNDPASADTTAGFRYAYDLDDDGDWEIGDGAYAGSSTSASATVPTSVLSAVGTYEVNGRIIDKDGGFTDYTTTITVQPPPNTAPIAAAGADQLVSAGDTVTLDGSGSTDPDTDPITYSWVQTSGPAVTLTGATTATPTFTAPAAGTDLTFELTVDDGELTDTDTVSVSVNEGPTADAGPDQPVNLGATVTLDGTGSSDPDAGDTLTYSWVQTGGGTVVTLTGADTAQPTFTAPEGPDTLAFEVTVTDERGETDTDTVIITVNGPPSADAGADQDAELGDTVTLDGSGSTDPEAGALLYSWVQTAGPAVTLVGANTAAPSFTAPAGPGTLTFELTVDDQSGRTDTDEVNVGLNDPPVADAGPDQDVLAGDTVTLDGTGSTDPEDDPVDYSWVQTAGPAVTITGATTATPTFTAPSGPATLTFELTVTDDEGLTDTDTVDVVVNGTPDADAGPDQDVDAGDTVTLDGTGSTDPEGDPLTYSWERTTGAPVTLAGANTASPTFTAPVGPATITFEVTVTDEPGDTDTDTVTITVNGAPTADAGPNQLVNAGDAVTLDGSGSSDPESDPVTYSWVQTDGPSVTLVGVNSAAPTFTAPAAGDVLTFELTVDDGEGGTDTDTVTITVNTPPVANAGADRTVLVGSSVSLDGRASTDAEGGTLGYTWTQTAGTSVTLTGATTAQPTFTSPADPATLTFGLTVDDGQGRTDTDTVTVQVVDPPALGVTTDHSCIPQGARLGLRLRTTGPTTLELATSDAQLLPVSRMSVDAAGLTVRPRASKSGVARVTITARHAGGSTTLVVRVVVGTDGDDGLAGSALTDVILARAGDDTANGRGARDLACGGPGDDRLRGGLGADVLYGEGGDDRLRGGAGEDVLHGGPGSNELTPRGLRLPSF